jgi:predicted porin
MVGDVRNVTRVGNLKFDERNANTIEYKSPKFGGGFNVLVHFHYMKQIAQMQQKMKDKDKAYDLALTYKEGNVDFAAAYEHYEEEATNGERDGFRIAGAYKITPDFNLGGMYQFLQHDNSTVTPDAQVFGVAGEYKFAPKTLVRGEVFYRDVDADDANSTLLAVGVEHRLDKAVRLYGNLQRLLMMTNQT